MTRAPKTMTRENQMHESGGKSMIRVAFFDTKEYDVRSFNVLQREDMIFEFFPERLTEKTASFAKNADAVCVFVNDDVNAKVIDALVEGGTKMIALRCAGFNNVDLEYANGRIHVDRVPEYSPYAVAEHAIGMLLTSVRRIHKAYMRTKSFDFGLEGLVGMDLHGKTIGVIGAGRIGRSFIQICNGFGMKVLAYDPFAKEVEGASLVPLTRIWESSDIISLHCPLNPSTHHIINEESIASMKKGVIIVNTSRGGLIDSEALLEGIKERKVGAACLDVYEEETDIFHNDLSGHILEDDVLARLISMPNVLVTSHQAFLTEEALSNIAATTLENITSFFKDFE